MTNGSDSAAKRDYSETLFLPKTDFPMRAGLPKREPELIARWDRLNVYRRQRELAKGREKFVLHDGPPYANGNIHIGTGLNKILKDIVTRSHQMLGYDSNYVPGWDCHGLPIEWKIEEQYRANGRNKDAVPINEFRKECRQFAEHWIGVQKEEFRRLGVEGDWDNPYTTMSFAAEAQIARELMKFAMNGGLYRGSKPVMWSVVEKTALAEAEVEYHDYQSDTIFVKFPIVEGPEAGNASVVIWTTTPWTIPGNRAISFSPRIEYGLYKVVEAAADNWAKPGDQYILADKLAADVMKAARVEHYERVRDIDYAEPPQMVCAHPLKGFSGGYAFKVPLLAGDHVTDDAGTGFVHTAPGHGVEDFEAWMDHRVELEGRGIDSTIPYTVDADGYFTKDAPGFDGKRVITDKGDKGDANQAVIDALAEAGTIIGRGRLKHQYPHSWRSKKPVIFRNTPQWFIGMDYSFDGLLADGSELDPGMRAAEGHYGGQDTLRARALLAIDETRFVPEAGKNRLHSMIADRPDWVISRQRAWGVPITVFRNTDRDSVWEGTLLPGSHPDWKNESQELEGRIYDAFVKEGADAWFEPGAKKRFLEGIVEDPENWEQVTDILDVWFDSGSTHSFVLEVRPDLKWPASVYLEGSDQHRGWFHSSLLESCGTRGRAPYDAVVTHGFVMAEDGRKMSKSLGNQVFPQDVIKQSGADILRLWVAFSDFSEDLRIGPEIIKTNVEAYRKLRNTVRWMLGSLAHYTGEDVAEAEMPELERYMLHRLAELDAMVRRAYLDYDYKRIAHALFNFATVDLSAFYFDIRKDALYCDPASSLKRKACLTVLDRIFRCFISWMAPLLPFTMDEAWLSRFPSEDGSVHFEVFPDVPENWRNEALADKWRRIRRVRRVITGALEGERAAKRIGSSLDAAPQVYFSDADLKAAIADVDLAEVSITSQIVVKDGDGPAEAYRLDEVSGVAVVPALAEGTKCARSWKILPDVGSDPAWPDLSPRDAAAMREFEASRAAAE